MNRWIKFTLILFGIVLISAISLAWYLLPRMILCPMRAAVQYDLIEQSKLPHSPSNGCDLQDFDTWTKDSLQLQGIILHSKLAQAKGCVILIHGIGGCKEQMAMKASEFASIGYHAVIFDLRAQGKSEGEFCTYGFNEKHDVKIITDRLIHLYPELPIGVFGVSLGGAIAYQCLANDNRLSFGIIESTFDDLKNVVREYTARFAGFRCDWVADFALWRAEQLAAFKSEEVVPWKCAAAIHVPVFVSHGNEDKNIPISFGKHNFENLGNPACKFYEVSGADHNNLNHVGGKTYQAAMNSFLEEQVRE